MTDIHWKRSHLTSTGMQKHRLGRFLSGLWSRSPSLLRSLWFYELGYKVFSSWFSQCQKQKRTQQQVNEHSWKRAYLPGVEDARRLKFQLGSPCHWRYSFFFNERSKYGQWPKNFKIGLEFFYTMNFFFSILRRWHIWKSSSLCIAFWKRSLQ